MAKIFDVIDDELRTFIDEQKMFFVATAPLAPDGHINLSPKGLAGTFAVIDDRTIAYLDLTGSGVETIAHLRENGRICVMFCAYDGRPRIVRVHGTGDVVEPNDAEFETPEHPLRRLSGRAFDHPSPREPYQRLLRVRRAAVRAQGRTRSASALGG